MQELRLIETDLLVDMLAYQTSEYLKLAGEIGKEEQYAKCYLTLRAIQAEIDSRKQVLTNNNSTDPNIVIQ